MQFLLAAAATVGSGMNVKLSHKKAKCFVFHEWFSIESDNQFKYCTSFYIFILPSISEDIFLTNSNHKRLLLIFRTFISFFFCLDELGFVVCSYSELSMEFGTYSESVGPLEWVTVSYKQISCPRRIQTKGRQNFNLFSGVRNNDSAV